MRFPACLFALLLGACAGPAVYRFTSSSGRPLPARARSCEFSVTGTAPSSGYEEIGILDFESGTGPNNAASYRAAVASQVCAAGGDLVVTEVNAYGYYVRGIVMRRVPSAEPSSGSPTPGK